MKHICVACTVFGLGLCEGRGEIEATGLLLEHAAAPQTTASRTPSSLIT
jgi:hypothetical protein